MICLSRRSLGFVYLFLIGIFFLNGCQSGKILPGDARNPSSVDGSSEHLTCAVCLNDVTDQEIAEHKAYSCTQHHCIDRECLTHQVKTFDNLHNLETKGLPCCGEGCKERLSLTTVRELLEPDERLALDIRLAKAATPGVEGVPKTDLQKMTEGIDESFNLCCPKEGCSSILDKIEGCNAATCSNDECKTTFCYLCLKPQVDDRAAHAHVKEHSGNYWEHRPGYTARYHWLIARKKLAHLFDRKIKWYHWILPQKKKELKAYLDSRAEALESRKTLLKENNMWPMPAGTSVKQWIQDVKEAHLPVDKSTDILQNEFIYRTQTRDWKATAILQKVMRKMGIKVLASLDIRDSGEPRSQAASAIIPVMADDPRVKPKFARLGSMYQVGNLIWSGRFPQQQTQKNAKALCKSLGGRARLPSREDYENLSVVLGAPNNYNPALIPDMDDWYWTATMVPEVPFVYVFNALDGSIDETLIEFAAAVRCVVEVRR